ncbi:Glutathione S-transferase class-mu 26 kDa like protein [Argiope bruennichi]|uniref:glutathione transferase n=1 Tax=Argiope bruennichi TaxID=94029 RepID=A0A8T0EQB3_ARGBR|nr:Glutathione S-transferase class-mu 26 kDa like protein [Argiope bruennichi]
MAKPILGYWELRGIAEPIRYLLHYKKVDFEDKRYAADESGYEEWEKDKLTLELNFPSLPYYIEGDLKLTHNIVIMRHLGYKYGLIGNTKEERRRVVIAEQQAVDFRDKFRSFVFKKEFETTGKEEFLKSVQPMFQQWERFLGSSKFLVGDELTYVDFLLYEALDHYRVFHETILDDFPSLRAYFNRMKNLPDLMDYINSSVHKSWPIFYHKAKFGGSGDPPKHF